MIEYDRGVFHRIDKYFYPAFTEDSTLGFSYFPPDWREINVRPDVTVFKHETGQLIIGPLDEVLTIARGLNIADSLGYQHLRQMHVMITHETYYSDVGIKQYVGKQPVSEELLERFGVKQILRESKLDKSINNIGVCPDLMYPVFFTVALEEWRSVDPLIAEILAVSNIVHEWGHVMQLRNELPVSSLWSERHAMTEQCLYMAKILNSNALNKQQQIQLSYILGYYSQRIFDYRNGKNFNDHMSSENQFDQGTPQKNQSIHNEDYRFGNH